MPWIIVLVALAAAGAYFWFFVLDHRTFAQVMEAEDGADPLKRWARGCYVLLNGKFDIGKSGNAGAKANMVSVAQRDWSVTDAAGAKKTLNELLENPNDNVAWDQVRRIVLARMAAGAGYLTQEESWAAIPASQVMIQGAYNSWDEMAKAYRKGLAAWSENNQDRLELFDMFCGEAKSIWSMVSFR
jgi:hypothetical protein